MTEEVWKDIPGYEGLYEISDKGNVRSLFYRHSPVVRISEIKQFPDKGGYMRFCIKRQGKVNTFKTHRVVAEVFIPNPNGYPQVNHKDENRQNNCAENLEWCTQKYNNNYGHYKERMKASISALNRGKPVAMIDLKTNKVMQTFKSAYQAFEETGIRYSHITCVCRGLRHFKSAGGYGWKYI